MQSRHVLLHCSVMGQTVKLQGCMATELHLFILVWWAILQRLFSEARLAYMVWHRCHAMLHTLEKYVSVSVLARLWSAAVVSWWVSQQCSRQLATLLVTANMWFTLICQHFGFSSVLFIFITESTSERHALKIVAATPWFCKFNQAWWISKRLIPKGNVNTTGYAILENFVLASKNVTLSRFLSQVFYLG